MPSDIEAALGRAEVALNAGRGLQGTGFWRAVDVMRRDHVLAERYADRAAAIDRRAFEAGVKLRVPAAIGVLGLALLSLLGVGAIVSAVRTGAPPPTTSLLHALGRVHFDVHRVRGFVPISFLVGTGLLIVGTHSLTHYVVGRAMGIRFTHVFLGGPKPPRPGLKTDYGTYLRATRMQRAVMHASGATVTKIVPFALLLASWRLYGFWPWLTWLLLLIGAVQIVTDVVLSTKVSDWMKVKRELRS